jgi:serine/threonine protein kinase
MVHECLAGGTLNALLREQSASRARLYSWRTCAHWMLQLAQAVEYMHGLRPVMVIHRDIKSDNILLTGGKAGREVADVKLTDLGLHRLVRCCCACD